MGIFEKYLKDIETVKQMKEDISKLKNELIELLRKHDGKERKDHSLEDRSIPAGQLEEIF